MVLSLSLPFPSLMLKLPIGGYIINTKGEYLLPKASISKDRKYEEYLYPIENREQYY